MWLLRIRHKIKKSCFLILLAVFGPDIIVPLLQHKFNFQRPTLRRVVAIDLGRIWFMCIIDIQEAFIFFSLSATVLLVWLTGFQRLLCPWKKLNLVRDLALFFRYSSSSPLSQLICMTLLVHVPRFWSVESEFLWPNQAIPNPMHSRRLLFPPFKIFFDYQNIEIRWQNWRTCTTWGLVFWKLYFFPFEL